MKLDVWSTAQLQNSISLINHLKSGGLEDIETIYETINAEIEERREAVRKIEPQPEPPPERPAVKFNLPKCPECGHDCNVAPVNTTRPLHIDGGEDLRSVVICPECHAERWSKKYPDELVEQVSQ